MSNIVLKTCFANHMFKNGKLLYVLIKFDHYTCNLKVYIILFMPKFARKQNIEAKLRKTGMTVHTWQQTGDLCTENH